MPGGRIFTTMAGDFDSSPAASDTDGADLILLSPESMEAVSAENNEGVFDVVGAAPHLLHTQPPTFWPMLPTLVFLFKLGIRWLAAIPERYERLSLYCAPEICRATALVPLKTGSVVAVEEEERPRPPARSCDGLDRRV